MLDFYEVRMTGRILQLNLFNFKLILNVLGEANRSGMRAPTDRSGLYLP